MHRHTRACTGYEARGACCRLLMGAVKVVRDLEGGVDFAIKSCIERCIFFCFAHFQTDSEINLLFMEVTLPYVVNIGFNLSSHYCHLVSRRAHHFPPVHLGHPFGPSTLSFTYILSFHIWLILLTVCSNVRMACCFLRPGAHQRDPSTKSKPPAITNMIQEHYGEQELA